jgi:2-oxoglutarate ferredoxin oxidoreductase subunit beta
VHDETDAVLAFLLSTMQPPKFPTPIGVFRAASRPTYDEALVRQVEQARAQQGAGDLDDLFNRGDTWVVN